ncbi:MAG: ammonium transporter [Oscillospiraceae bacterium]|nr:ammonium transporter [Oscillospiraceae bacterium]
MVNTGSIAFMILCSTYVFIMTPGLAFFYGGLSQRKNVVNTMMMSICIMGLAAFLWVLCGYSLSFSGDSFGGLIGDFKWWGFNGVSMTEAGPYAGEIPNACFAWFQMMFALITPALFTGAVAGRMKFKAIFPFIGLWLFLVYFPMAHMVWGKGFIDAKLHAIDFAGGNVVHISSGITALILCLLVGPRKGFRKGKNFLPHNIPFIVLGAALLWFGWFGFNGGSALAANGLAIHACFTSNTSAATAMLTWMLIDTFKDGKPTLIGACTGAVAGLVAITPAAGFVPIWASFVFGAVVTPICYFSISVLKQKIGYDDALDAFSCHGVGGIVGCILTGIFADPAINGQTGLIYGGSSLFIAQLLSIVVTAVVAIVGTFIAIGIVRIFTKLRVEEEEEYVGLNSSEHSEIPYPSMM